MRLNDAVHAVTGEVFRDGWSRIRGSMQGLHVAKQTQLVRAAAGHRPAVFKAIRGGGTHTKSQLANQLDYLTTKSSHIVDSSGFLDGKTKLEAIKDIKDLTERFAKRWRCGLQTQAGPDHPYAHVLSPSARAARMCATSPTDVAERFFQTDEGHFDYIIAVHEDRDHPHAHLVLNRRSQEGEFFFLGRNHRFNYDDFRLAMVEEAEKYRGASGSHAAGGSRRRALPSRALARSMPRKKRVARPAEPRPRVGADLDRGRWRRDRQHQNRLPFACRWRFLPDRPRGHRQCALPRRAEVLAKGGKLDLDRRCVYGRGSIASRI